MESIADNGWNAVLQTRCGREFLIRGITTTLPFKNNL
jgi:hypothetical protein